MKRHPSLAKAGHDKSLKCCDILIKYVEFFNLKLACLKLCIFIGSCYVLNSYKHYNCHLTAQRSLEQFNRFLT